MDTLQSRLAAARRAAGLTQATAAKALHVHEKTVARWETCPTGHGPSLSALQAMASLYGVTVGSLIDTTPPPR